MTEQESTGTIEVESIARELARIRQRSVSLSEQIEVAEEALRKLEATKTYDKLHEALSENIDKEKELEDELRKTALDVAIELQLETPAPGVTVTKKTTFTIKDESEAVEACRESYPQLIKEKVDKGALKKIVVALGEAIKGTSLNIEEFGQVKIATNLEEHYLTDATSESDVPF